MNLPSPAEELASLTRCAGRGSPRGPKPSPERVDLPLEDVELAQGVQGAAQEKAAALLDGRSGGGSARRNRNRGRLPAHLPRVERVIEPGSRLCPCGCGETAKIGESPPSGSFRGMSPSGST